MKILHLIDSAGLYGAERVLLTLVSEQISHGLEPLILSAGTPECGDKAIEIEAKNLGLPLVPWRMKPGFNVKETIKIVKWAKKNRYSILHSHGYKFNVLLGVVPYSFRGLPLICTAHGYLDSKAFTKNWLYESIDRYILGRAEKIVFVASKMMHDFPDKLRKSGKVSVINNGINVDSVLESSISSLNSEMSDFFRKFSPVFVGVGRFSPEKNFSELVNSFKLIKDLHPSCGLVLVGDGEGRREVQLQLENYGLAHCSLLPGYVNNVPAILRSSDILVIPSLTEGLPITLLEAMIVGTAIVASDVGEIAKVLGFGKGGRITSGSNAEIIAEAILDTLDKPQRVSLQKEWSFREVREFYSSKVMTDRYSALYKELEDRSFS